MTTFLLNGAQATTHASPTTPVLDIIRSELGLTGTKEGCREGDCGACTVLLGRSTTAGMAYLAVNSCILPTAELEGCHLVTVEGLRRAGGLTLVQRLLVKHGGSQCGFCTPGMVMSLTGYLLGTTSPTTEGAVTALGGNICRCTGYAAVVRAAEELCRLAGDSSSPIAADISHLERLISLEVLPDYFREVGKLLADMTVPPPPCPGDRTDEVIIAGGTDIMVRMDGARGQVRFLSGESGLSDISVTGDSCVIGAAATVTGMLESPLVQAVPGLEAALELVSSIQVRNVATVGGNIVNASPIGDLTIILLALGTDLEVEENSRSRTIPLEEFYLGYKKLDLAPGGLLTRITFPLPDKDSRLSFEKISMRRHLDIASVNSAALICSSSGKIVRAAVSAGGVGPIPLLLRRTSELLTGRVIDPVLIGEASRTAMEEISPISDVRGSAEYKRRLLGRLMTAHLLGGERR